MFDWIKSLFGFAPDVKAAVNAPAAAVMAEPAAVSTTTRVMPVVDSAPKAAPKPKADKPKAAPKPKATKAAPAKTGAAVSKAASKKAAPKS